MKWNTPTVMQAVVKNGKLSTTDYGSYDFSKKYPQWVLSNLSSEESVETVIVTVKRVKTK